MPRRNEPITTRKLVKQIDFDADDADYLRWKREKVEAALRYADEHPDDFLTEKEIWTKHGIDY